MSNSPSSPHLLTHVLVAPVLRSERVTAVGDEIQTWVEVPSRCIVVKLGRGVFGPEDIALIRFVLVAIREHLMARPLARVDPLGRLAETLSGALTSLSRVVPGEVSAWCRVGFRHRHELDIALLLKERQCRHGHRLRLGPTHGESVAIPLIVKA